MSALLRLIFAAVFLSTALLRADVVIVFNEVMYHPRAADAATEASREWIELRSQMAVDLDVSGWRLAGGVDFRFPAGSIIPAGGYFVIAADPAAFQALTGVGGAFGPWVGQLGNNGETIELRNNNARVMDSVDYGTDGAWPSAPDGGGASLAKKKRNLASDEPSSWRSSRTAGGTPAGDNFPSVLPTVTTNLIPFGASWKYKADGLDQQTAWRTAVFADSEWNDGLASFAFGENPLPPPALVRTALPSGPVTYYFRHRFTFSGAASATTLRAKLLVDDGTAVYLNGTELVRSNLPPGAVGYTTPAPNPRRAAPVFQEFLLSGALLQTGENILAVETHQAANLPSYPSAVIASAPISYWRLGETANPIADLADLSAAPESGPQAGNFQGVQPGNLGAAGPRPSDGLAGFDALNTGPSFQGNGDGGDDVATFADNGVFNFSVNRKFSAEAWIKASSAQEDGAAIICKGTGGGGEQFCLDVVGGRLRLFVRDGNAAATVAQSNVAPNNTWQHVVVIYDQSAGLMRLYVNGALAVSGTPPGTLLNTTHEISVGARKNSASPAYGLNFNGTVDEVALYNRALSPAEITAHYNAAFAAGSSDTDVADAVFDLEFTAFETPPLPTPPSLALNEISTAGVELVNHGSTPFDLTGASLFRTGGGTSASTLLPAQTLAPGEFLQVALASIPGDRLVLYAADAATVLDSTTVTSVPRARRPDGTGAWLHPSAITPGGANVFTLHDEIVINEIMFDHPSGTLFPPGTPQVGQWIELHNRSSVAVDLSGWRMTGGVSFAFPAGMVLAAGGYLVVAENPAGLGAAHGLPAGAVAGPWSGNLSHSHDELTLEDASGNPADEVRFFAGDRWPEAADAGGSSLELRDEGADNNRPEAWAASDETGKAAWQTFTWRGPNNPSQPGEPTLWRELDLLLVDGPGECLIDDVRVTDTVTNANLIQNGNFDAGATHWRLLGNHRTSRVEPEAGVGSNNVLHLIASGPGEYQGNQIESTFLNNQALVAGREYEVSLRARWLSGGGRLNTRLYFNRLPRTNLLSVVRNGGTPGAANSRAESNIGPTYTGLSHSPVLPAAGETVIVTVDAADPESVGAVALKYSANGGPWQTVPMTLSNTSGARYSGSIPGQTASATVQFYIEGQDSAGATSFFPRRGVNSRALYQVNDGASSGPLPVFRLLMTAADAAFLHQPVNTLSNEDVGTTVVADGGDVYYDAGVRLKGSFVGRNVARVGFIVRFNSDDRYRGVLDKVAIDRSMHTAINNPAELIVKHMANQAGGIPSMYDDLTRLVHPISSYSGVAAVRLAAFEDEYLDSQFPRGGDGTMFEFEVLRWALATVDGNPESQKLPGNESGGTGYLNLDLADYGDNKEAYRWNSLQTRGRDEDDYSGLIALEKMFALAGSAFDAAARQRIDVEEWLRTLAYQNLVGTADTAYTGSNIHNFRLYFRPHDGRGLYLPWDWDSAFQRASTDPSLTGTGNIAKVVTVTPDNTRRYYSHLYDIITTTYNTGYMSRWTQHYGALAGQDYSAYLNYIGQRATYVLSRLPTGTAFSAMAGPVTPNGATTITGAANIRVVSIEVNGLAYVPTWVSNTAWAITVPLAAGSNTLNVRGLDRSGNAVAGTNVTLVVENPNTSGWPVLRINEWIAENEGSGFDAADGDSEDWFEIYNPNPQAVNVSGWKLSDTPAAPHLFVIPNGWVVPAGGYLVVWADNEPVQNPAAPGAGSHLHVNFKLDEDGETLVLTAPDNREIDRVTFARQTADQSQGGYPDGNSVIEPLTLPSPGTPNILARYVTLDFASAAPTATITSTPGTRYQLESSTDLSNWLVASDPVTATTDRITFSLGVDASNRFFRVRVSR